MKLTQWLTRFALVGALALTATSNAMASDKSNNTLLGAGLGAAAGAIFSEGDPLITLGSAAAGGVLGNVLTEDRRDNWRGNNWRGDRHYRSRDWDNRGPRWRKASKHYRHDRGHYRGHRHHR